MDHIMCFKTAQVDILSYRDVFHDGEDKLHPAFRLGEVLLVLTNTRPRQTPFVRLESGRVRSGHFKAKGKWVYITYAYNQEAQRFNNIAGGTLRLEDTDLKALEVTFQLPDDWQNFIINTFKNVFNMNFKSIASPDAKAYVILANPADHKPSKDLAEFGLQKRVAGGITGLVKAGTLCKDPVAILAYFNQLAEDIITGKKALPPENILLQELEGNFLPSVLGMAWTALSAQLVGKPGAEGPLTTEQIESLILKAAGDDEYNARAACIGDLICLYNGTTDDLTVLRLSETFGIPIDKVTVVPETAIEAAAEAIGATVEAPAAEAAAAPAAPAAGVEVPESPAAPETPETPTEAIVNTVVPANVSRLRKMSGLIEAASVFTSYVAAEVAEMKKESEQAAGLPVEEIKPTLALPTAVEEVAA